MNVWINGEEREIPPTASITDLLQYLRLNPRLLALEYNGEILHRQDWPTTAPSPGDRFEIVTIVGGG